MNPILAYQYQTTRRPVAPTCDFTGRPLSHAEFAERQRSLSTAVQYARTASANLDLTAGDRERERLRSLVQSGARYWARQYSMTLVPQTRAPLQDGLGGRIQ